MLLCLLGVVLLLGLVGFELPLGRLGFVLLLGLLLGGMFVFGDSLFFGGIPVLVSQSLWSPFSNSQLSHGCQDALTALERASHAVGLSNCSLQCLDQSIKTDPVEHL